MYVLDGDTPIGALGGAVIARGDDHARHLTGRDFTQQVDDLVAGRAVEVSGGYVVRLRASLCPSSASTTRIESSSRVSGSHAGSGASTCHAHR